MFSGDVGKVSDEFLNGYPSAVYGRVLGSSEGDPSHFPQTGLNLKSCVLPISLQEPLKHL